LQTVIIIIIIIIAIIIQPLFDDDTLLKKIKKYKHNYIACNIEMSLYSTYIVQFFIIINQLGIMLS